MAQMGRPGLSFEQKEELRKRWRRPDRLLANLKIYQGVTLASLSLDTAKRYRLLKFWLRAKPFGRRYRLAWIALLPQMFVRIGATKSDGGRKYPIGASRFQRDVGFSTNAKARWMDNVHGGNNLGIRPRRRDVATTKGGTNGTSAPESGWLAIVVSPNGDTLLVGSVPKPVTLKRNDIKPFENSVAETEFSIFPHVQDDVLRRRRSLFEVVINGQRRSAISNNCGEFGAGVVKAVRELRRLAEENSGISQLPPEIPTNPIAIKAFDQRSLEDAN